ncbi:uncharacterized protein LOC144450225 [Glandiceps talaboti]
MGCSSSQPTSQNTSSKVNGDGDRNEQNTDQDTDEPPSMQGDDDTQREEKDSGAVSPDNSDEIKPQESNKNQTESSISEQNSNKSATKIKSQSPSIKSKGSGTSPDKSESVTKKDSDKSVAIATSGTSPDETQSITTKDSDKSVALTTSGTSPSQTQSITKKDSDKSTVTATTKSSHSNTPSNQSGKSTQATAGNLNNQSQEEFMNAMRAMCGLVNTDQLYAYCKPGVYSLHLERIPLNPDFSMTTLVSRMENITELDVSGNRLGPQGFRAVILSLVYNHTISTLNISNNQADTDSAECIGHLLSVNTTLTWLDVSSNTLGKDFFSRTVGPPMKSNNSLKCLSFASCGSTDLNVFLENLSDNTSLVELDCSHNQLTDGCHSGQLMAEFVKKPNCKIEVLQMKSTGLDAKGMKSLSEGLLSNKSLKKLNLGGNELGSAADTVDILLACVYHPSLHTLCLDDSKIVNRDTAMTETVKQTDQVSELTSLSLVNCMLTDDIINTLTNQMTGVLCNLSCLDLTNNPDISMATVMCFQKATIKGDSVCPITELHLGLNNIDSLPDSLGDDMVFPKLHSLDLRKAKINPSTVGKLSKYLQKPAGIQKLCLDGMKLSGSTAIEDLLQYGSSCSLQSLSLSGCALNDSDITPVAQSIKQGLLLHMLRLSANRLSDSSVVAMVEAIQSHGSYPLKGLDLSQNKISNKGAEALSTLVSCNECQLQSLSVNGNCISTEGLQTLTSAATKNATIKSLECKDQKQSFDEDDITQIFTILANNLDYTLEIDQYGEYKPSTSVLPKVHTGLTINVSGLGGLTGSLGRLIDSQVIKTDYSKKHPPYLRLQEVLELYAALRGDSDGIPTLTSDEWNMITGCEKNTSVPSWLKVSSHRDTAVYMTHLSASVSEGKLEGVLETEADCAVKEVCLVKDPVMRKPTGVAWLLMANKESVKSAVEWYHTGQAILYGQPFTISAVNVKVLESGDGDQEEKVRLEMLQRQQQKKAESVEHQTLLEASFQASKQRHEYSKAHPAYADGRVW